VLEKADLATLIEEIRDQMYPDDESPEVEDAEKLLRHVGKIGYLQLGFPCQGIMFLFEVSTDWYDRFQDLMETVGDLGSIVVDDRDNED
jgi:hypothetical protein